MKQESRLITKIQSLVLIFSFFFCFLSYSNGNDTIILKECDFHSLQEVCLSHKPKFLKINSYKSDSLPNEIGDLKRLEVLDINFGKFHSIPSSIGNLGNLKKLTISNGYTNLKISSEIGQLTKLTELNIYNYEIDTLPEEIGNLVNLEKVMLCGKLKSLPESVRNWKKVNNLYLAGNELNEVPTYIFEFDKLESLDISRNNISQISDSLNFLKNLKKFNCSGNITLLKLPNKLCQLEKLEFIDITNTMISSFPNCLSKMESLRKMKVCKDLFPEFKPFNKELLPKIEWSWRCGYLQSNLIDFSEAFGSHSTSLKRSKDTLFLIYNYFYNRPNVIDEEFS